MDEREIVVFSQAKIAICEIKERSTNRETMNLFDISKRGIYSQLPKSRNNEPFLIYLLEMVCLSLMMLKKEGFLKKNDEYFLDLNYSKFIYYKLRTN